MARVHDANVRRIAQDIAALKQDMRVVKNRKPGLAYSSIEDGAIREYDKDGVLVSQTGKQPDGTHNHVVVNGPKPPKPAGLSASAQPGLIEIRWNGKFAGGVVSPLDLKHVAAYVVPSGEFLDLSDQAGVMTGELGDNIQVQAEPGVYTVYLVAWSMAGKFSDAAGPAPVLVTAPADMDVIQGALDELDEKYDGVITEAGQLGGRLDQAEQDLADHDQRLGTVDQRISDAFVEIGQTDSKAQGAADAAAAAQADADTAKSEADDAQQQALQAAGIANAKGEVIYQATAPTGSRASKANLWIRARDNKPHTYDDAAGKWVAVTDQAALDAAQAAAAAQSKADAAAQAAANAQAAAGSAQQTADGALTMAGSRTSVFYSTKAPSGQGDHEGALWRQWDENKNVIGRWIWDGSSWLKDKLSSDVIDNLDVGKLTAGSGVIADLVAQTIASATAGFQRADIKNLFVTTGTFAEAVINKLWADVIHARKITLNMLAIGDFNNYIATGLGVNNEAIDWASGLTPDFEDVPPGISHSFKTTVGQGTKASTATKFDVNPGEEFVFEVWVKADKPNSRIFIEMRDQNGAHGVTSTMLSEDDNFVGNASYPVQNAVVPTVWTRWRARCIPKPGVRQVYIASIYFNHPNGTEKNAQVWLAGLSFRKRFGGEAVLDGSMKARHIDVVDLAADNGFIADLTSKIVKSDVFQGKEFFGGTFVGANFWTSPLAGVGMKIDDQGLRAYGPEGGEPVAEIRPDGGTVYQVSNPTTGEVLGGIDSEGNGTFQELRAADARFDGAVVIGGDALHDSAYGVNTPGDLGPVILGRSLIGTGFQEYFDSHPRVTDRTSWLDALPFGLVARGYRDITGTAITNREQEVLELRYPGNSSRGYKITVLPWSVYHQGGSYLALNIYRTTDGTRPTMRDEDRFIRKIIKNETSNYLMRDLGGTFYDLANATGIVRYLFTFEATDGRAQVFDFSGGGFRVFVEDIGLLVSDSGVNRTGSRANAGSTPAPSNPPEPDPVKSYTDTISASWWQAYTGDNSQATHSTYSGAAAQGRTPYAPGNGVMRGLVGFPSQASRLSGATVKKIEVYVYAKSWHASAGGTAVLGVHGHGSKPGSFSATTNDVKRQKLKRPEGRWITLPSSVHAGFKSGSLRGISFYPPSGSTSTEYYGIFTGNKTKLRITYEK